MPFNQKKYIKDYNKNNYKMIPFRIKNSEIGVLEKLKTVPSINKYIFSLIENDINPQVLTIKQIKERMLPILNKHRISEIYLFGSYARGEANKDSDIDIYCNAGDIKTLIQQGFLEDELEQSLGKKVDIIFIGNKMDPFFEEQLEKDKIKIC